MLDRIALPPAWSEALADAARAAGRMARLGWAPEAAGNLSLRLPPPLDSAALPAAPLKVFHLRHPWSLLTGRWFLFSLSGSTMAQVAADPAAHTMICSVSEAGLVLLTWCCTALDSRWRPTSELAAHLAVQECQLRLAQPYTAVLHAHTPNLSWIYRDILPPTSAGLTQALVAAEPALVQGLPEGVELAQGEPASELLGRLTAAASARSRVVLWPGHGAVVLGPTLEVAADLLELAEHAARQARLKLGLSEPALPAGPAM